MLFTFLRYIAWFILLFVLQVFVFNHVQIAGYATPLPFFYFLLLFPISTPRWLTILLGFLMGIGIDIFSNTIGIAAATNTLVALVAPILLNVFVSEDKRDEDFLPTIRTMGWTIFSNYVLVLSILHCSLFFVLENFSFFNLSHVLITIASSTALTFVIVLGIERIRSAA